MPTPGSSWVTYLPLASQHARSGCATRWGDPAHQQGGAGVLPEGHAGDAGADLGPAAARHLPHTFNLNRPELQDVRVRQALSMAIDRRLLTEKVSGQESVPPGPCCPACRIMTSLARPRPGGAADPAGRCRPAGPGGLQQRPSPQADADLQHLGEPQEAGPGGGGHVEAAGVEVVLNNLGVERLSGGQGQRRLHAGPLILVRRLRGASSMLGSFRCQDPQNESGYCNPASTVCCSRRRRPWMPRPGPGSIIRRNNC